MKVIQYRLIFPDLLIPRNTYQIEGHYIVEELQVRVNYLQSGEK